MRFLMVAKKCTRAASIYQIRILTWAEACNRLVNQCLMATGRRNRNVIQCQNHVRTRVKTLSKFLPYYRTALQNK